MPWALVLVGAAACTFRLWEQDVFWQVRAGYELLRTGRWPTVDAWSYTAAGGPWRNFQWLSTLLMALADALGGSAGLVLLRDLGVAGFLATTLFVLRRRGASPWGAMALLGLVWLAAARRFQIRSDLFVTVVFALAVATASSSWGWRTRRIVLVVLVVLAANLHAGTAPFVQLAALVALTVDARGWRHEILPAAGILLGILATPYHVHVGPYLWRHLFYAAYSAVPNPDHRPLELAHFLPSAGGLGPAAWLALVLAGTVVLVRQVRAKGTALLAHEAVPLLVLVLLAAMSVDRDRVMPYAAVFAVACVAGSFTARELSRSLVRVSAAVAGTIWLLAIPSWLARPEVRFGFGLDERMLPVGAARFIASHRPERQLLHFQGDGNYLLRALPEYPVFLDTRETMYEGLDLVYRDMVNDPDLFASVVDRYDVNAALLPEAFLMTAWRGKVSRRAAFLPKRDWALVYFDDTHVVFVRRIAQHRALIAEHEYELLLPYREPAAYLATRDRTAELDRVFEREVARCRAEVPSLAHCQRAEAALSKP